MNLELCNLNHLWLNATTTEKARTISYYDQDYICLLTEVDGSDSLFLSMNDASQCIESLGLLKINQPDSGNNTFSISLSDKIQKIDSIIIGPNTTTSIQGPQSFLQLNNITSDNINIDDVQQLKISTCISTDGCVLSDITGSIVNLNNENNSIDFSNCELNQSNILSYDISIDDKCSFTDCKIMSNNKLSINTATIYNTLCSGKTVAYNAGKFGIALIAFDSIDVDSAQVIGGSLIGSSANTIATIKNTRLVSALSLDNIASLEIEALPSGKIRGYYTARNSIRIIGDSADKVELTSSFATNTHDVKIENFINYGTISAERIELSDGVNYGTINGKYVNIADSVTNYGIIQGI